MAKMLQVRQHHTKNNLSWKQTYFISLIYLSLFVLDCAGDVVKLTLANDALAIQGSYAGYYKPSSVVNGKPSFKNGRNAIWYDDKNDDWNIGSIGNLGSATCAIYTDNKFGGLTDSRNKWKYSNDGFKSAGPHDVNVQCLLEGNLHKERTLQTLDNFPCYSHHKFKITIFETLS